ncbi:MAG: hypothetical protein HYX78_12980 [Armatimonadetes bacterium]|nr:hypothetical protein [Armatimonadota bacterium]
MKTILHRMCAAAILSFLTASAGGSARLFPDNLPERQWVTFSADGYSQKVTGAVYRGGNMLPGVPLGGLGTGFISLGADGALDYYSTIFNAYMERRYLAGGHASVPGENVDVKMRRRYVPQWREPCMALSVGGKTHLLAVCWVNTWTADLVQAKDLHYWGHYPIADMLFDLHDSPIEVDVRAWSPFIPGDPVSSNTPGAVFEARLQNRTAERQRGTLAFSFHGPREAEVGGKTRFRRQEVTGDFTGVIVSTENAGKEYSYAIGAAGGAPVRAGGEVHGPEWRTISGDLPRPEAEHPGATVAVDFDLQASQQKKIQLILTWYAPRWRTQVRPPFPDGGHLYDGQQFWGKSEMVHMYFTRFRSALDAAQYLAREHKTLLNRILAWQERVYGQKELSGWLQDALINIFSVLAQQSFWDRNADPNHWWGPDGIFCVNESLIACPQQACIANDEFGEWPVDLFFPELARNKLRVFKHYQKENGQTPSTLGAGTEPDAPWYNQQLPVDGQVYIHMADRIWQATGDRNFLQEYYPSVKAGLNFMKTVDEDGDCLLDVKGSNQYYDSWPTMAGAAIHISGYWLATLRIAERMAETMGDRAFAEDCRSWINRGTASIETKLWNEAGGSYLLYHQPETGRRSDSILSDQLIGQLFAHLHGLPRVFQEERVKTVLETIWSHNVKAAKYGVRTAIRPDMSTDAEGFYSRLQCPSYSSLTPAMLMIYGGDTNRGLDLMQSLWRRMVLEGSMAWDMPAHITPDGESAFGQEYYHNTMLWILPLAVLKQNIRTACSPGGFIYEIKAAGRR